MTTSLLEAHGARALRSFFTYRPRSSRIVQQLRRQVQPQLRRRHASTNSQQHPQSVEEPLIPAPTSGPLMSRQPNRALPTLSPGISQSTKTWLKTLPIFIFLCTAGTLSIFNYQKSSSSTVASIMYALRTSPSCRELLGDNIYFSSKVPWISGELNQLHGNIDISFWVKGTKQNGLVKFVSVRRKRGGYFETLEWSLKTEDGQVVQLLDQGEDPLAGAELDL